METINGLIEFIYVVESGSFSQASRTLKVSKSHISKQVQRLENNLQVSLLNRTTRKLTLTDPGKLLYEKSRHLLNDLESIYAQVTQKQKEPTGTIKISVAGAFAEEFLSECFSSFLKIYQKVRIELHFSERFVDLVEEGYDLAIRYGNLKDSTLISKKLAARQEFICASPEYISKHGRPLKPKDLKNHQCLAGTNSKWTFLDGQKKQQISVNGSLNSNNGRAISTAAKNGLGIAKLPGAYVYDDIQNGKLVSLLKKYTEREQNIWIVYPPKKYIPQKTRLLIEYLDKFFKENYKGIIF